MPDYLPNRYDPGSPLWWITRMLPKLDEQAKRVRDLEQLIDVGYDQLPEPPSAMIRDHRWLEALQSFKTLSKMGVTNLLPMVAQAPSDRMQVTGFRFGDVAKPERDDVLWPMWQRNHLKADSRLAIDTPLQTGNCYTLVWPDAKTGKARITIEHPAEMIIAYGSGDRRNRLAALKRWVDETGFVFVTLYLPTGIYKYQSKSSTNFVHAMGVNNWVERHVTGEEWPLPNPWGKVTAVELAVNTTLRPRPFGGGRAEIDGPARPIQARVNKGVFDRLNIQESHAYPQRWVAGWTPKTPDDELKAGVSRMLTFSDKDTKAGQWDPADLSGLFKGLESDVALLAVSTFTPQSYMPLDLKNLGAETIAQTNLGYVSKTKRHLDHISEGLTETLRLGLEVENDPRWQDPAGQVLWEDIELHTLGEAVDAAVKKKSLGIPLEEIWASLPGVTQDDVDRWKAMSAAGAFLAGADLGAAGAPGPAA